jgi:hypothetical protein
VNEINRLTESARQLARQGAAELARSTAAEVAAMLAVEAQALVRRGAALMREIDETVEAQRVDDGLPQLGGGR